MNDLMLVNASYIVVVITVLLTYFIAVQQKKSELVKFLRKYDTRK